MNPEQKPKPPNGLKLPRLSLRAKGVAALTVPLLALFAALVSVFFVENQTRDSDILVARAYDTRRDLLELQVRLLEAESAMGSYLAAHQKTRLAAFDSAREKAEELLRNLAAMMAGDADGAAAARELQRRSSEVTGVLSEMRNQPDEALSRSRLEHARTLMDGLRPHVTAVFEAQARRIKQARLQGTAGRQRLFRVTIVCGVLGPLGALFVHLLITGRIVRRLQEVEENARRLAHGVPLAPLEGANDEIASVARQIETAAYLLQERERSLRQSESRYRDLFDRAPIPYEETDTGGVVRRFNQEVCALLHCTPDRVLGRLAWDFIAPDQQAEFRAAMLERIASGQESGPLECDYLLEDGSRISVEVRESLIRDAAGNVTGVCRSLMDVTERNLAALAARKVSQYATELRHKNEQLGRALDAARSATEAKSRFLASVSHELRTPLNGIIGFSELMQDGKLGPVSEEQRDIMGDILMSARHLLQLISDILDISKVEAGKMEFRLEHTAIPKLVDAVRDVLKPVADQKRLELTTHVPEGLEAVLDPARLRQVLLNYLSNAVKFTPPGGRVKLSVALAGESLLRIEVEDTGIGIAPEDMPLLFTEFRQLPNNRRPDQGTGLGLAVSRHIVEAQGGTVGVRSVLGKGSVFIAELPINPKRP
jgi:PAS domain S-box-containing protein